MPSRERLASHRALRVVATFAATLSVGCAGLTPEQQAAIARVKIIASEPGEACQNLGQVSGSMDSDGAGGVRAKAVFLGGNTVHADPKGTTTAFYCPQMPQRLPDGVAPPR